MINAKKVLLVFFGLFLGLVFLECFFRVNVLIVGKKNESIEKINETKNLYVYDGIFGWSLRPNVRARQINKEFGVEYRTNGQGFRSGVDYLRKKSGPRGAIFGDSFVFGVGVNEEENFSSLVSKKTGYEILNFGVSGYDPGQYLISLEEKISEYDFDFAVYSLYLGNDIEDLVLDHPFQGDRYKPYFDLEGDGLVLRGYPVPDKKYETDYVDHRIKNTGVRSLAGWIFETEIFKLFKNSAKNSLYPIWEDLGLVKSIGDYEKNFTVLEKIISRTKEDLRGRDFYVVIIPSKNIKFNYLEKAFAEKVRLTLSSGGIDFIDLTEEAMKRNDLYFPEEGHFNKVGHSLVAEKLSVALKNYEK